MAHRKADGRWIASWTDDRRIRRHKSFSGPHARRLAVAFEGREREKSHLVRRGFLLREDLTVAEGARLEVQEAIDRYLAELERMGRKKIYVKEKRRLAQEFFNWCPAGQLGAVQQEHVLEFLTRYDGGSRRNYNVHLLAIRGVFGHAVQQGWIRARDNPAAFVKLKPESIGGEGINRQRPLTREEYRKLIREDLVVKSGRSLAYQIRMITLIRGEELARLKRQDLKTQGDIVFLDVAGGCSKTGRPRLLPLPPGLAADMLRRVVGYWEEAPLFRGQMGRHTWERDLERAGVEFETEAGAAYRKSMRLTGSIWHRQLGIPLQDEMLLAGVAGAGAARVRVHAYHDWISELPRLYGHVSRLEAWLNEQAAIAAKGATG